MNESMSLLDQIKDHLRNGQEKQAEDILLHHPGFWDTHDIVHGDTPLHSLVEYLIIDRCAWAIEHGAGLETRNKQGMTALHVAANMDDGEMVDFLIKKGSDIEARDETGATPLLYACGMGCEMSMEHLIARGANISAVNDQGMGMLGCFLSGSFYHDWEQAEATADWLQQHYSHSERAEAAFSEIQRVKNAKNNGKSMFPGLVSHIEAAQLSLAQAEIAVKSSNSRRF